MFNFKKTAEDVLKMFEGLSEEEKAKVLSNLKPPETEDEAQIDEAEEHIEERGEENGTADQTETDVEEESAEQTDEVPNEPRVKNDSEDRFKALTARIDALEAIVNDMRQAQADAVEKEHDRDFGMSPFVPDGAEEENRYKRVMRGYAKNSSNQYL